MRIESEVMNLFRRNKVPGPRGPVHVSAIDQHQQVMFRGVDFPDVVFDGGLSGNYPDIFRLPDTGAYKYSCTVVLPEQVPDTDEEYLPVFVREKLTDFIRHL